MAYGLFYPTSGSLPNVLRVRCPSSFVSGYALSTATKYIGIVFRCNYAENITGARMFIANQTGSPTSVKVDLYAVDSSGNPTGSSLANWTGTSLSNVNTYTFSAAYTPSLGTYYAIVVSNATATPGSNYPNFGVNLSSNTPLDHYWSPFDPIQTTDGSTWVHSNMDCLIAPVYATAGTDYIYAINSVTSGNHGTALYNTSGSRKARIAVKMNFPVSCKLWGAQVNVGGAVGSPSFNITAELCSSSASLLTFDDVLAAGNNSNRDYLFKTWSGYTLSANTDYYLAITPTAATAGDSSNYQAIGYGLTLQGAPTQGILLGTYHSTASGSPSWSSSASTPVHIEPYVEILAGSGGSTNVGSRIGPGALIRN